MEVTLVVLAIVSVLALSAGRQPPWPEHVGPETGTAEEAVARVLDLIAGGEWAEVTDLVTTRHGLDQPAMARLLQLALEPLGDLERWGITGSEPGDPVLVTIVCQFSRVPRVTLQLEAFAAAEGWRVGHVFPPLALPSVNWLVAATERLQLRVWPGHRGDLDSLVRLGEQGFDQALGPLLAGDEPLPGWASVPVTVYVFESKQQLGAAAHRPPSARLLGTTYANAVLMVSSAERSDQSFYQLLVHELNHLLLWRYARARDPAPAAIPAWLSEGMAGLAAGQLEGRRREDFFRSQPSLSRVLGLPTPGDLAEAFNTSPVAGHWRQWTYEYAFALAEYLTMRHGPDALRRLVDMIGDGLSSAGALVELTGVTVEELTLDWHGWLLRRMPGS